MTNQEPSSQPSSSRRWFYPLLAVVIAGLIGFFYVITPQPASVPVPATDSSAIPEPAKRPDLNIPLGDAPKASPSASSKKTASPKASAAQQGADVADEDVETLREDANNLEKFTTLEDSGVAKLTLDGMYTGEFSYNDQMCGLEADLRVNYVKSSGKPPRGRWEYLVTCNDNIKASGSGIEALSSHMRLAGSGQWLLTNPSRPRGILEFRILSKDEIEFSVYEMRDGKYHLGGSGTAYNTESR